MIVDVMPAFPDKFHRLFEFLLPFTGTGSSVRISKSCNERPQEQLT
jgi:hypothetical protein